MTLERDFSSAGEVPKNLEQMAEKTNVLVSTDIGTDVDDAVALYLAMNSEKINLQGVYVTNGPVRHRAMIARHMLNLGRHNALVAVGEEKALLTTVPLYTTGAEEYMAPRQRRQKRWRSQIVEDWLSAMAAQLEKLKDVVVASIAPLTNIAVLLEKRPDVAAKIKRLYVMGGRLNELEHNFSHDSAAAQRVLASNLDIIIVSANVCSRFRLDINTLTSLCASRAQRYLAHMASLWKLYHDSRNILTPDFYRSLEQHKYKGIKSISKEECERLGTYLLYLKMLCVPANFRDNPIYHLRSYKEFTSWASKNQDKGIAQHFLAQIKASGMKDTQVADAFVIYAMVHPERIKIEKVEASCDERGVMRLRNGNKHKLVVDVDYSHFETFLRKRLSEPPQN